MQAPSDTIWYHTTLTLAHTLIIYKIINIFDNLNTLSFQLPRNIFFNKIGLLIMELLKKNNLRVRFMTVRRKAT